MLRGKKVTIAERNTACNIYFVQVGAEGINSIFVILFGFCAIFGQTEF